MSKKSVNLSKKERQIYGRLITKKLKDMGIKDIITMHEVGKPRLRVKTNPNGSVFLNENGVPEVEQYRSLQARNVLRNMVKNLLDQPKAVVSAFLAVKMPAGDKQESK